MNLGQLIDPEYAQRGFFERWPRLKPQDTAAHMPAARTITKLNPGSPNDPATPETHKAQRGILKPMLLEVLRTRQHVTAQQLVDALPRAFSLTSVVSSLNSLARGGEVRLTQHTRPRRWSLAQPARK